MKYLPAQIPCHGSPHAGSQITDGNRCNEHQQGDQNHFQSDAPHVGHLDMIHVHAGPCITAGGVRGSHGE